MAQATTCPCCSARVTPGATQCPACRSSLAGLFGPGAPRPAPAPPPGVRTGYGRLPLGPLSSRPPSHGPAPAQRPAPSAPPSQRASAPARVAQGVALQDPSQAFSGQRTIALPARPPPSDDSEETATSDDSTHRRVSPDAGVVLHERYRLASQLGEGALGASWIARDLRTGGDVIVKVVADMLVTNDRERSDLAGKLEMFTGRALPGVMMPREVFAAPGCVALVYPYVDAVSLRAVIDARHGAGRRFTPEECLRVAQSLASAVQGMHTASPHGALWPQNVLVTARGLLLVDGFLAVSVAPERLAACAEHHPRSLPFAAPELLQGRRPTASADLYALGAIVAELAGGAPPGHGPDLASVSPELHRAVGMLLDREPGRRPAGLRAMLDALTAAAGFAQRPAEPPLVVPETVLARPVPDALAHEMKPALEPPTAQAPPTPAAPPRPAHAPPACGPPAAIMAPPPDATPPPSAQVPPGRLRPPTTTLPLGSSRNAQSGAVTSGPPASMSVKSGPPAGMRPMSGPPSATGPERPSAPVAAPKLAMPAQPPAGSAQRSLPSINQALSAASKMARTNAPTVRMPSVPSARGPMPAMRPAPPNAPPSAGLPPARPAASGRPAVGPPSAPSPARPPPRKPPAPQERSFTDEDGIDPRLLKAAQMLADDRHRREGTQEISLDDIEGVDE